MTIAIKRIYEPPSRTDGRRVLVDRIWPRGIAKDGARIDLWMKDAAPSTELRKWFGHDPAKWEEFQRRYRAELEDGSALSELRRLSREATVTLVYAAKDEAHNNAEALRRIVERDKGP